MGRVSEEDVKVLSRVLSSLPGGASYFDGPAWRGVVRLDSWECRQMPAALESYRDERVFLAMARSCLRLRPDAGRWS